MPSVTFSSDATWVPSDDGVVDGQVVTIEVIAKGGDGAVGAIGGGGGGGGGGGYARTDIWIPVASAEYYFLVSGADWQFLYSDNATVMAQATSGADASGGTGGSGGAAAIGDVVRAGGNGGAGTLTAGGGGGSGAGDADPGNDGADAGLNVGGAGGAGVTQLGASGGNGGNGGDLNTDGASGAVYGAGGGGGGGGATQANGSFAAGIFKASWSVVPAVAAPGGVEIFDADATWTCPEGITSVDIECWGGGGGGEGGVETWSGSGGGAGSYAKKIGDTVTPGTTYLLLVGVGGSWGSSSSTATSFIEEGIGSHCSAAGGYYYLGGDSTSNIGDIVYDGGDGGLRVDTDTAGGGGGGSGGLTGVGNAGATPTTSTGGPGGAALSTDDGAGGNGADEAMTDGGRPGGIPGGGGGGGAIYVNPETYHVGGQGGHGRIRLTYEDINRSAGMFGGDAAGENSESSFGDVADGYA